MKVSQLAGLLQKMCEENGDFEVHAGLASGGNEYRVVDAAFLDDDPPATGRGAVGRMRQPRVVLALDEP